MFIQKRVEKTQHLQQVLCKRNFPSMLFVESKISGRPWQQLVAILSQQAKGDKTMQSVITQVSGNINKTR